MGVKSLWKLLTPVGRPVLLETLEGKVLAIDSSIWIYQFQATMRDNDGKLFVNAHVLGFLRRICKLLFYGIKPVFVFDGGAPTLKRSTINERKRKKSGAAAAHVKVAERLLAAQMRREAVEQAQQRAAPNTSKGKGKQPQGSVIIDNDTVYLEDFENPPHKVPAKTRPPKDKESSHSSKHTRFHDHDPYHLPDIDFEKAVAKATRASAPDPRLPTEEEMREFIDEMRPEDFDVNAPEFRELPTEVQYEIIGDLRLKSRQTSYKRLQNMLRNAPTPLDFSKEQIKNLKQRNKLTQQLLITTDSIGKAHVEIPIRIASERNREYVLTKNEGESGGWILGLRDEGTQAKPIVLDPDHNKVKSVIVEGEDSDDDMEEVAIPPATVMDPHLREYQREMALSALAGRVKQTSQQLPGRTQKSQPLFNPDEEDELGYNQNLVDDGVEEDSAFSQAIQESLRHQEASDLQRALDASRGELIPGSPVQRGSPSFQQLLPDLMPEEKPNLFTSPGRLATALSIANAGPSTSRISSFSSAPHNPAIFGNPKLLLCNAQRSPARSPQAESVSDDDMETSIDPSTSLGDPSQRAVTDTIAPLIPAAVRKSASPSPSRESSIEYMEHDIRPSDINLSLLPDLLPHSIGSSNAEDDMEEVIVQQSSIQPKQSHVAVEDGDLRPPPAVSLTTPTGPTGTGLAGRSESPSPIAGLSKYQDESDHEELLTDWSRSPSPRSRGVLDSGTPMQTEDNWDAAQEMDPDAEQGEFARFMSQMKGRDLDDVRKEIEAEIKDLKQQKKIATRDSEDITQQMISQIMIMLRLFGIPYITAPMEAEAQCAKLISLGLVEGIITDDSDVFLFGGNRVFKHMFNQSKTVECFLASDLIRELGLDRDMLIRLAYLLGSDYVDGLSGVGPVVAMELLREFPGNDGLHKFKDWWIKVQTGRDRTEDNKSKFRKRFKKKFKDLYLPPEWPNPAVRDAYYHPTVDESEEPFKWGLPDLDGLRGLFREELGWGQQKVDDLLLPVIQRVGKRQQAAALNKQGNLDGFFNINASGANTGSYAPRNRQPYASKRLQQVVTDYRNEQKKQRGGSHRSTPSLDETQDEEEWSGESSATKKRKASSPAAKSVKAASKRARTGSRGGRGRRRGMGKRKTVTESEDDKSSFTEADQDQAVIADRVAAVELRPRPKPRPIYNTERGTDDGP